MILHMVWIFAAVVLYLAVVHDGFRRVVLWIGGCGLCLAALFFFMVIANFK